MEVQFETSSDTLQVMISGRLDTTTSPQLEAELFPRLTGIKKVVLDFTNLQYTSSSGLRILLATQKKMNDVKGTMEIHHVNELIQEIFYATGFSDILNIAKD